jgi:death-on-curing protein
MISLKTAQTIHRILIERFGGADGIRDTQGLESALLRPFQSFENEYLYPDVLSKAAALIESLIGNHPFIDGNKRTGYVLMRLFLISNHADINASEQEKFDFVMGIASGKMKYDDIVRWLQYHIIEAKA